MQKRRRTEHIELYFGCKNRRQKKMAQLKATSGLVLRSMSETGVTTAKKVSAFSTTKMEISTKVCGHLISAKGKAHTGAWKAKN